MTMRAAVLETVISEGVRSPAEHGRGLHRGRKSGLSPGPSLSDREGNSTPMVALLH